MSEFFSSLWNDRTRLLHRSRGSNSRFGLNILEGVHRVGFFWGAEGEHGGKSRTLGLSLAITSTIQVADSRRRLSPWWSRRSVIAPDQNVFRSHREAGLQPICRSRRPVRFSG